MATTRKNIETVSCVSAWLKCKIKLAYYSKMTGLYKEESYLCSYNDLKLPKKILGFHMCLSHRSDRCMDRVIIAFSNKKSKYEALVIINVMIMRVNTTNRL